jgi:hypothetical protein
MANGMKKGPVSLAVAIGRTLDPAVARRGFASVDLLASWDSVVGPRYAGFTQPEKLAPPRQGDGPGVLTVRVDGPRAVFLQHELPQFIDRINRFLGYAAVGEVRIVQKPMPAPPKPAPKAPPPLPAEVEKALDEAVATVGDEGLREALRRLGRAVAGSRLAQP